MNHEKINQKSKNYRKKTDIQWRIYETTLQIVILYPGIRFNDLYRELVQQLPGIYRSQLSHTIGDLFRNKKIKAENKKFYPLELKE